MIYYRVGVFLYYCLLLITLNQAKKNNVLFVADSKESNEKSVFIMLAKPNAFLPFQIIA